MAKVITFFGADSQVGCTMTAASVCQALKEKKQKVLLILASSQIEEGWFGGSATIDLGVLLRLNVISNDDVLGAIVKGDNFDFIRGFHDPLKKQWFDVLTLSKVIEVVDSLYDYVILDGGWDVTLPLAQSTLFYASRRMYVFTGSEKTFARFMTCKTAVIDGLGLNSENDYVILNKDSRRNVGMNDLALLKSSFTMEGFSIPMYDNPATYEVDKVCPYSKAGAAYQKAINAIAEDIMRVGR